MIDNFDSTVLNRIHLVLKYDNLDHDARRKIFTHFLEKIDDKIRNELDKLINIKLNNRQVSFES